MKNKFHQFHIVEIRPWPILTAFSIFSITTASILWIQIKSLNFLIVSILIVIILAYLWWRDITREAKSQGIHQEIVIVGLKIGIILFITSEILFFISFFWAYYHRRVSPNIDLGQNWPPLNISPFDPLNVPLLNTIILLSSGVSVTWSHHAIIENKLKQAKNRLGITFLLGFYFSVLQGIEYIQAEFSISDSIYGATFFIATGFHGIHVLIGSSFLLICLIRIKANEFNKNHLIGFEAAAWYWHFVDIVWIFLYISIYWWGA